VFSSRPTPWAPGKETAVKTAKPFADPSLGCLCRGNEDQAQMNLVVRGRYHLLPSISLVSSKQP